MLVSHFLSVPISSFLSLERKRCLSLGELCFRVVECRRLPVDCFMFREWGGVPLGVLFDGDGGRVSIGMGVVPSRTGVWIHPIQIRWLFGNVRRDKHNLASVIMKRQQPLETTSAHELDKMKRRDFMRES